MIGQWGAAYHVRKFAKIVQALTAIGFKGQRNNNRGGGRRPGFEASRQHCRHFPREYNILSLIIQRACAYKENTASLRD